MGLFIAVAGAVIRPDAALADDGSAVLVFKDGHRQRLDDVARIEFGTPAVIVFRDKHRQNVPTADIARIEFASSGASTPARSDFVGKWEAGQGNGQSFLITLYANGRAWKSTGPGAGTWAVVDGEARIAWDDGWHDAIVRVGSRHLKLGYRPGLPFEGTPSNVSAANNTQLGPG
jgi:hypothetical protein